MTWPNMLIIWLDGWLSVFYGISIFVGYLRQIYFYANSSISNNSVSHEYTIWLSKTFLFQAIQFIQTILIQLIQFSISMDFFTHS